MNLRQDLLRPRVGHEHAPVSNVELFFDLVFVFAVTQLSHGLIEHLSLGGALETLMLFLAVWWLWIYTAWMTNWLDPEKTPVRLMLFVLMLGGLLVSSSIPEAFGGQGLVFGCAFAAMQVGRSFFAMVAFREHRPTNYRTFIRITIWFAVSGVFWVWGALSQDDARVGLWFVAIAIEYVSPWIYFWLPVLGASKTTDWDIEGAHLAERCSLFIIIALGESILVTGATFAGLAWSELHLAAFLAAFVGSVAMWWVYFDTGAQRASRRIARSEDPGRQGRLAYTYIHLLIVMGIIVSAVADEIVLTHPDHTDAAGVAAILSGPGLYLLGNALFKWVTSDRRAPPLSHCAGLLLLIALVPVATAQLVSPLELGTATTAILVIVAVWESMVLRTPPAISKREAT